MLVCVFLGFAHVDYSRATLCPTYKCKLATKLAFEFLFIPSMSRQADACLRVSFETGNGVRQCPCSCSSIASGGGALHRGHCKLAPVSTLSNLTTFTYNGLVVTLIFFSSAFRALRDSDIIMYHAVSMAVPYAVQHAHFHQSTGAVLATLALVLAAAAAKMVYGVRSVYAVTVDPGNCAAHTGCDENVYAFYSSLVASMLLVLLDAFIVWLLFKHAELIHTFRKRQRTAAR